jgi:hypothetical protein
MGLLDDAIKQHLELKRKHGAAEEEVKRQEAEALGPARRDFAAAEPAAEAAPEPEPEPEAPREPASWLDEDEAPAVTEQPTVEHPAPPALEPEPDLEPQLREDPAPLRPEPPAPVETETTRGDTPAQGFPAVSREEDVIDSDAEEIVDGEDSDEDEDVLEETPEFLQDTPEHDRLWFEQKPPRDFDFDG